MFQPPVELLINCILFSPKFLSPLVVWIFVCGLIYSASLRKSVIVHISKIISTICQSKHSNRCQPSWFEKAVALVPRGAAANQNVLISNYSNIKVSKLNYPTKSLKLNWILVENKKMHININSSVTEKKKKEFTVGCFGLSK